MQGYSNKVTISTIFLILVFALQSSAQEASETEKTQRKITWGWTLIEAHHKAVTVLHCGDSIGEGTLIYSCDSEGIILTAYSLVQSGENIKVTFANGQRGKGCQLICHNEKWALLKTWAPKNANTAKLATKTEGKQKLQVLGLKGSGSLSNLTRVFEKTIESPQETQAAIVEELILPNIGAPIFRDKEIVGVILGPKQGTEDNISKTSKALQTFASRKK